MDYALVQQHTEARSVAWRPGALRVLLLGYFALFGLTLGATGVLWADIQHALRVSDGVYGTALLVTPLTGAVVLLATGALVRRTSTRVVALASLALIAVGEIGLIAVADVWTFVTVRALTGVGYGLLQGCINSATLDWERTAGRPTMNVMHAAFSGGAVLGALAAGGLLDASWHYGQVSLALATLTLLLCAATVPVPFAPHGPDAARGAERLSATVAALARRFDVRLMVALSFLAASAEAIVGVWSVIYLRELGASVLVGGTVLALFNGAMFAGRLGCAAMIARSGARSAVLVSSYGVLVAAALLLPAHVNTATLAFAVLGLAVAGVVPTVLSVSARIAAGRATAISTMIMEAAFIGYILAPPAAGSISSLTHLHGSLLALFATIGCSMLGLARAFPARSTGEHHD
jgi:MFS family permease